MHSYNPHPQQYHDSFNISIDLNRHMFVMIFNRIGISSYIPICDLFLDKDATSWEPL